MRFNIYIGLIIASTFLLLKCSPPSPSINDKENRNSNYIWWENKDGKFEWIKKDENGKWEPTNGKVTEFHDNGQIKFTKQYKNAKINGPFNAWNKQGNLIVTGYYTDDRPDSTFSVFYPNGKPLATLLINNQHLEYATIFNKKGTNAAELHFQSSEVGLYLHGDQSFYYENGNPKILYKNNKRSIFDSNKNLIEERDVPDLSLMQTVLFTELFKFYLSKCYTSDEIEFTPGCISGDCENGKGVYVSETGGIFTGEFKNGFLNGAGKIEDINKIVIYEGVFKNGYFEGQGNFTSDLVSYIGQFENELYNGEGKKTDYDGTIYIGTFLNDKENGQGKVTWKDGSSYEGEFKNDKFDGFGKQMRPDGESYVGYYKNGLFNGKGTFTKSDGQTFEGIWKDGDLVK